MRLIGNALALTAISASLIGCGPSSSYSDTLKAVEAYTADTGHLPPNEDVDTLLPAVYRHLYVVRDPLFGRVTVEQAQSCADGTPIRVHSIPSDIDLSPTSRTITLSLFCGSSTIVASDEIDGASWFRSGMILPAKTSKNG